MRDKLSETRIAKLHPKVRDIFTKFIEECEAMDPEITLRVSQGLRTFPEQDALYAKGRTTPGPKVTNSKAGQSYHNYGLAIDLVELDGNKNEIVDWNFDMGKLEAISKKYGLTWGGNFRSLKDKPHFELSFGYSWQQLLDKHNAGNVDEKGYVNI